MSSPSLQVLLSYNDPNYFSDHRTPVHHSLEMQSVVTHAIPLVLHFNNLTYSVNVHTRKMPFATRKQPATENTKVLLNDVSGVAREGEIFAILGPSGSGKSTLLDALANRIAKGSLKGAVTLNGEQLESKLTKIISAYVMQDDLLFPMLTVEETLTFAAEFRLPRTLSKSEKKQRVEALIHQLGLQNARNTVIGDQSHRGVSGGERRRVSIGIDIIHDPILLFLDEPTSGLDSTSAFMVVKVLQAIARSGSIVIMSVHQPSYRILGLIDRLLFLSRGEAVYNGSPTEIPQYFSAFGNAIPEIENRLEFVLDFIRDLENSPGGTKELVEFNKACLKMKTETPSKSGLSLKEAITASISRGKLVSGTRIDTTMPKFANPFWVEIGVLSRRSFINSRRMPELFGMRLGVILVSGFFLSTIFWHLDDSPRGVRERLGFFAFVLSTMFYSCADQLPVFIHDRHIFMRETAYNAYRCSSYVIYHILVDVPSLVLLSLMLALVTFWTVNLDGGLLGLLFYAITILASYWAGTSFVIFISSLVSQAILGYTIIMSILSYFLLLSGFFIYRDRIPPYWIWFHYMSLIKYPFQATMQNEFEDPVKCFTRGVQMFDNTVLGSETTAMKEKLLQSLIRTLGRTIGSTTCVTTGADILQQVGINDLSKWNSLWITVAWGILFRFLFYMSLLLGNKNKRI